MKNILVILIFVFAHQISIAQPYILDLSTDTSSVSATGEIVNGRRHGIWISVNANGVRIEKEYNNGTLHGPFKSTRKNGVVMETGRFENGLKDGPWVNYFPNSDTLILTTYKKGLKEGLYLRYQENKKLLYKGSFTKDKMDGTWLEYSPERPGEKRYLIRTEYNYKLGVLDGTTTTYYTTKTTTQLYKNGVLQKSQDVPVKNAVAVTPDAPEEITPTTAVDVEEEPVLAFAEEMPSFPGGQAAMEKYFRDSLRYPQAERDSGIGATVYVYFEVAKDGSIGNVMIKKGVPGHLAFDREAMRVVSGMPKWSPGKIDGKPVKVSMSVPVKFAVK